MAVHVDDDLGAKTCRVLVAEDAFIVAEMIVTVLRDCGCAEVGPFATIDEGLKAVHSEKWLSGALLDVNLNGTDVFPLAEELRQRGVPMIFLTGYDRSILPALFKDCPFLEKPFSVGELKAAIRRVFAVPVSAPPPRIQLDETMIGH